MNKALLSKWLWRFGVEEDSLWRRVIALKYGVQIDGNPRQPRGPYGLSPLKGIMKMFHDFNVALRVEVGDGQKTRF